MKAKALLYLPILSLVTIVVFMTSSHVSAQEEPTVTVTPTTMSLTTIANGSLEEVIRYNNKLSVPVAIQLSIEPITEVLGKDRRIVKEWVNLSENNFNVDAGAYKNIAMSIEIPKGADVGPYFFKIIANVKALHEQDEREIFLFASPLTTQVSLTIKGKLIEQAEIINVSGPSLFEDNSSIRFSIYNSGNASITPTGTIILHSISNNFSQPLEFEPQTIPAGGSHEFIVRLPQRLILGKYSVDIQLFYGLSHKEMLGSISFYHIPIQEILVFLVSTLAALIIIYLLNKYKSRIRKALYYLRHDENEYTKPY